MSSGTREIQRTISCRIQHNEPRIYRRGFALVCPSHRIRVTAQTRLFLVQVNFVRGRTQGPERGEPGYAAADYGYTFAFHFMVQGGWECTGEDK